MNKYRRALAILGLAAAMDSTVPACQYGRLYEFIEVECEIPLSYSFSKKKGSGIFILREKYT
jgi:hypothetical protein